MQSEPYSKDLDVRENEPISVSIEKKVSRGNWPTLWWSDTDNVRRFVEQKRSPTIVNLTNLRILILKWITAILINIFNSTLIAPQLNETLMPPVNLKACDRTPLILGQSTNYLEIRSLQKGALITICYETCPSIEEKQLYIAHPRLRRTRNYPYMSAFNFILQISWNNFAGAEENIWKGTGFLSGIAELRAINKQNSITV